MNRAVSTFVRNTTSVGCVLGLIIYGVKFACCPRITVENDDTKSGTMQSKLEHISLLLSGQANGCKKKE